MSRPTNIEDLELAGFDIVKPAEIFGRSSQLCSGEPIYDGGYRAVTADEIFGSGSSLVEADVVSALEPSFAYTSIYQLFVVVSFILYLHMLLRSWGFIGVIWGNIFSVHSERNMASEGGELPLSYFKVVAIIVGIMMLSLVALRIVDIELPASSPLYTGLFLSVAPFASLLFVGVLVAWLYALHTISGWISQSSAVDELSSISTINFVRYVVLLYPLVATWLVASRESVSEWGVAVICGTILLLLIYLKDTFVFFIGKKIPILYWILYLCTAFLLPISFVVTMLPAQM